MSNKRVPNDDPEISITMFDFEEQPRDPPWRDLCALSTKQKLEETLCSGSLWNKAFVIACVIAVSLDPLFFYIPIINEEEKCLGIDKELKTIALILRSLTDVIFIVHIIYHICKAILAAGKEYKRENTELGLDWDCSKVPIDEIIPFAKLVAWKLAWLPTLTSLLAVLPMPQLLVVLVFYKMRGHGYLEHRKILNVLLFTQYLPRIYQIYLSSQKLRQTAEIWAKAVFNFFLYILASHVIGAFWYFFSIQRETSCWHRACDKNSTDPIRCISTLWCDSKITTARNATFLNQFCTVIVEANTTAPFDYGMFLDSLKNGITGDIHFATKLSYCFWWGLRNLSNFGTNLQASTYVWETCFAVFISIIGLLLFLYLIGNLQTFMSMETQRWEEIRKKIQLKEKDIEGWMDRYELPNDIKKEIRRNIKQKLEENKDADLENLFSILPTYTKTCLKRFLCMKILRKVPKLERMDGKALKMMCDYLKPVMYDESTIVFQMGDPLHSILFITEGTILTYKTTCNDSHHGAAENVTSGISASPLLGNLDKGDFYGAEELIKWASQTEVNLAEVPLSTLNVKCDSKVEGFALTAKDLIRVASECEYCWKLGINNNIRVAGRNQTTANARNVQQKPGVTPQY